MFSCEIVASLDRLSAPRPSPPDSHPNMIININPLCFSGKQTSKFSYSVIFLKGRAMIPNSVSSDPIRTSPPPPPPPPCCFPAKSQTVTVGLLRRSFVFTLPALGLLSVCFVCLCVHGLTLEARLGAIDLFTCAPLTASH